jgi:succinoglycan biosynthesis transport protein ExoP
MTYMHPQEPPQWQQPPAELPPFHWLPNTLSFLRRRWLVVAVCLGACVGLALAYALTATPRFTAEVDLLFDISRTDLLRQQTTPHDSLTLNAILESQVELLQSAGLARKTVERLGLAGEGRFASSPPGPVERLKSLLVRLRGSPALRSGPYDEVDLAARQLLQMIKVRRVGQSYVIGIAATSPSADEAARLANGLADTYLADQLQAKEDGIHQATGWLQVRIKELHDQALAADRAVQDYKAQHNIIDTERGLMGNQQLTELSSQLVSAHANAATMLARLQRIESMMRDGVAEGNVTEGLDNKVIVGLRQQYVDDDRRVAELAAKFGKDHVVVRDLRNEMVELKKSIQGELARIAETYKSDYEVAKANEVSLQARLDEMVTTAAQTNNDLVVLRSLQSSADTYRSLYQNFLQRYTQAVQDQSFPVPEARIITAAVPPQRKSEPRTTIILAFAVVLGGGLGFAVAFAREILDRGVRSAAQVVAETGLNCLGVVPRLRRRWLRRTGRPAVSRRTRLGLSTSALLSFPGSILRQVIDAPRSGFADAIRAVRMRIVYQHLRSRDIKVIGCMSSSQGAGASTIAANLAQLLAQTDGRTILVDLDFLRASLSKELIGRAGPGCLEVLGENVAVPAVVHQDQRTGLSFLAAGDLSSGRPSAAPGQSEQMHNLLAQLRCTYSHVVVDLPSLSSVTDMHYAAHMLDAIVVVAQWGRPEGTQLAEKLARIGLDETGVLGVILNKSKLSEHWRQPMAAPAREHRAAAMTVA